MPGRPSSATAAGLYYTQHDDGHKLFKLILFLGGKDPLRDEEGMMTYRERFGGSCAGLRWIQEHMPGREREGSGLYMCAAGLYGSVP